MFCEFKLIRIDDDTWACRACACPLPSVDADGKQCTIVRATVIEGRRGVYHGARAGDCRAIIAHHEKDHGSKACLAADVHEKISVWRRRLKADEDQL